MTKLDRDKKHQHVGGAAMTLMGVVSGVIGVVQSVSIISSIVFDLTKTNQVASAARYSQDNIPNNKPLIYQNIRENQITIFS